MPDTITNTLAEEEKKKTIKYKQMRAKRQWPERKSFCLCFDCYVVDVFFFSLVFVAVVVVG